MALQGVTIHHLGDAAAAALTQDKPHAAIGAAASAGAAAGAAGSGDAAAPVAVEAEAGGGSSRHSSQFLARRLLTFAGIMIG